MKLRDYMTSRDLTAKAFAETIGATEFAVTKWLRGERRPSGDLMMRIVDATDGAVTPNDFFDLPERASA